MKTAGLALMTIGFTVLMSGTSYAATSSSAARQGSPATSEDTASNRPRAAHLATADGGKHRSGEKPSGEQPGNRRSSDKNHTPSQASLSKANHPDRIPSRQEHSASGNARNLHEPGSDKPAGAAKLGVIQSEIAKNTLPVRPSSVVRPTAPSLDNVRHRSPNSAVVGGSASSATRNAGAINGTRMTRKP
jgi:hypothetical protein